VIIRFFLITEEHPKTVSHRHIYWSLSKLRWPGVGSRKRALTWAPSDKSGPQVKHGLKARNGSNHWPEGAERRAREKCG
jgi:hypothetical protein